MPLKLANTGVGPHRHAAALRRIHRVAAGHDDAVRELASSGDGRTGGSCRRRCRPADPKAGRSSSPMRCPESNCPSGRGHIFDERIEESVRDSSRRSGVDPGVVIAAHRLGHLFPRLPDSGSLNRIAQPPASICISKAAGQAADITCFRRQSAGQFASNRHVEVHRIRRVQVRRDAHVVAADEIDFRRRERETRAQPPESSAGRRGSADR